MTKKELNKYVKEITDRKLNPILVVNSLMHSASYDDMKAFEKRLPFIYRGLLKLPNLKRRDYSKIYSSGYLISKNSPLEYIDLLIYLFEKNADILNKYVNYRCNFENSVLMGNYNDAQCILGKISKEISFSLWGAICDIKVTRLSDGLNACNDKVYLYSDLIKDFSFVLYWNYKTSSIDISFSQYVDSVYNEFKDKDDYVLNYVVAHCFPYKGYNDEGEWLFRDFNSSLIDLYVAFVHLLTRHLKSIDKGSQLANHLNRLSSILHDPLLIKYSALVNQTFLSNFDDIERSSIIKSYLIKDDDNVITKSKDFLTKNPSDFKILDIWVKSLLRNRKRLPDDINENNLFGKVATYYYKFMKYGGNHHLNYSRLSNIYNALHTFVCFRQLSEMVESRHRNSIENTYSNAWRYSSHQDFTDIAYYIESERLDYANNYLEELVISKNESAIVLNSPFFHLQILNRTLSDEIWEETLSRLHGNAYPYYLKGPLSAYMIDRLIKGGRLAEAISIFVEQKINDPFIQIQIDLRDVKRKLDEDEVERGLGIPLVMSIFHTITNSISSKRKLAYRRYLKQRGVEKASELPVDSNDHYLIFFLTEVIDTDVLQLDGLRFKNSLQALDERIKIFQNLYNVTGNKEYYKELALLDNEKTIKGLTKTLDQSKIFVDTDALIEREVNDLRDLYGLYIHTGDTVKTIEADERLNQLKDKLKSILADSDNNEHQIIYIDASKSYQEIYYKNSLFRQFYLAVRDKFLIDPKYGLDYHLSTRIRHGFLSNQIRTNFVDKNLVTNIGPENKYALDIYWSNKTLKLSEEDKEKCQKLLLDFTVYLDSVISTIKDELIQVKTEKNNTDLCSCFDYSDKYLTNLIEETQESCISANFDVTVNTIFESLWGLTEFNLQMMKDQLDHYSMLVQGRLDTLEHDVLQLVSLPAKDAKLFQAATASAKTQFQNDMLAVSRWFNRKNELASEFNLELSLQTCIDTINRINQYKIEADSDISSNLVYKGKYLSRFNDLFHNLLNNVLDYNKRKNRNGKCKIQLNEDDDWLTIKVSNHIEPEDLDKVKDDTTINKEEIDARLSSGKSRGEGHSGIVKIYNIVHNVFRHPENRYDYNLEDFYLTAIIRINISNLVQKDENINS